MSSYTRTRERRTQRKLTPRKVQGYVQASFDAYEQEQARRFYRLLLTFGVGALILGAVVGLTVYRLAEWGAL